MKIYPEFKAIKHQYNYRLYEILNTEIAEMMWEVGGHIALHLRNKNADSIMEKMVCSQLANVLNKSYGNFFGFKSLIDSNKFYLQFVDFIYIKHFFATLNWRNIQYVVGHSHNERTSIFLQLIDIGYLSSKIDFKKRLKEKENEFVKNSKLNTLTDLTNLYNNSELDIRIGKKRLEEQNLGCYDSAKSIFKKNTAFFKWYTSIEKEVLFDYNDLDEATVDLLQLIRNSILRHQQSITNAINFAINKCCWELGKLFFSKKKGRNHSQILFIMKIY